MADLSPWPTDAEARMAALRELERHLKYPEIDIDIGEERERLELVAEAASALVERYSPGAPQRLRDLAVVRTCQYLLARSGASVSRVDESLGDWSHQIEFQASMVSALRASGSMAVLSPFKIRRARKVTAA